MGSTQHRYTNTMSQNEKTTFGATIEHKSPLPLATRDAPPSPLTTSSQPPSNPFYDLDGANRTSTDLKVPQSYANDLEGQRSNADLSLAQTTLSREGDRRDDSMWPSLKTQKEDAKRQKKEKCAESWNPLTRMGKRQKLIVTAGIAVGVSKAVNGGVKSANGNTRPIGDNDRS